MTAAALLLPGCGCCECTCGKYPESFIIRISGYPSDEFFEQMPLSDRNGDYEATFRDNSPFENTCCYNSELQYKRTAGGKDYYVSAGAGIWLIPEAEGYRVTCFLVTYNPPTGTPPQSSDYICGADWSSGHYTFVDSCGEIIGAVKYPFAGFESKWEVIA